MARIHDTVPCWDGAAGKSVYRDQKHGALDDAFWPEDELVDYRRKGGRNKKPGQRRSGCPGNNNKTHIYVYTTEKNNIDLFYRYFGFHKYEKKICAGCGIVKGYRLTEQYTKKFKSTHKWTNAEYRHEGYSAYRRDYINRHGFNSYVYSWPW